MKQYLISVRRSEGNKLIDSTIEFEETEVTMEQILAVYHPFIMRARLNVCKVYNIITDLTLKEVEQFLITAPENRIEQWEI